MSSLERVIIVGAGWAGKTIAAVLGRHHPKKIIGFVDDCFVAETINVPNGDGGFPLRVLGHSKDLVEIVKQHNASGVVIAVTHNREDHLLAQIVRCYQEKIPVFEMPDLFAKLTQKIPVQHLNHHWVAPNFSAPPNSLYTLFHDTTNYIFSFFGLFFIFAPLFPFISLAIKLDSKGPIYYRQKRYGKKGRAFMLLKFRTMCKDADQNGSAWTTKTDDRITRVGRFLRKYRLDELPQFINVLKGEMSLIGPRPEAVELVDQFKRQIPFYEYRYLVRPGITGWAQVNHENTCSVDGAFEKLQYDLYWIKNRSLRLDLKIILKSIKVILTGFGAV